MMRTFSARLRARGRSLTGVLARGRRGTLYGGIPRFRGASKFPRYGGGGSRSPRASLASNAGDTLIEVLISSLLVGLIVVATLTGFDETTRVSQDERAHDQASVLAAQSQEQLRSDPASTLDALAAAPHEYTQTVGGTKYTITQKVQFINGSGGATGCSNSKSETEESKNLEVSSSVDWKTLEAVKRKAVTQTSIITPPDGSGLEVDVTNLGKPEIGVSGVTVFAGGVETTTGTAGCVIYAGIPATTTNIEAYRLGYVTPGGEHKFIAKEVSIAPNITTHEPIYLANGGRITAKFEYKKSPKYKNGTVEETVKGDTFVAANNKMAVAPEFEIGSTEFSFDSEDEYEPLIGRINETGTPKTEGYSTQSETAKKAPYYPTGDLFPFTNAWTVYAGDCPANNPTKYGPKPGEPVVPAGGNITVSVPTSYVALNVYKKTGSAEKETSQQEVKITNASCTGEIPQVVADNAIKSNYVHRQMTNTEGHLEVPFQPFGKFELCLAYNSGTNHRTYTTPASYENKTEAGTILPSLYVSETATNANWTVTPSSSTIKC
jgi:Tfp pilus assembly protein PilV